MLYFWCMRQRVWIRWVISRERKYQLRRSSNTRWTVTLNANVERQMWQLCDIDPFCLVRVTFLSQKLRFNLVLGHVQWFPMCARGAPVVLLRNQVVSTICHVRSFSVCLWSGQSTPEGCLHYLSVKICPDWTGPISQSVRRQNLTIFFGRNLPGSIHFGPILLGSNVSRKNK